MISVGRDNTLPSGLTAAYSAIMHKEGETVPVMHDDREGTAIVMKTTLILGGQLFLLYLDVDWASFERFPDGE